MTLDKLTIETNALREQLARFVIVAPEGHCEYDEHDHCLEHGWGRPCAVAEGRRLLGLDTLPPPVDNSPQPAGDPWQGAHGAQTQANGPRRDA